MKIDRKQLRSLIENVLKENDVPGHEILIMPKSGSIVHNNKNDEESVTFSSKLPFTANDKASSKASVMTARARGRIYQVSVSGKKITLKGESGQEIAIAAS